jgi:hypothetical protein
VIAVSCQLTPVRPPAGGAEALGAGVGVAVGVGAGVALAAGLGLAAGVRDALGAAVAVGPADGGGVGVGEADGEADADSEAEADGDAEADSDGLGEANADAEGEAWATGDAPGTPATKVIESPSARDRVSCPSAIDHFVAVVRAWAKRGPNESSGHIASVETPGLIVIPSEPLVVYAPEIRLQSAVPLYVPSVLKVIA